MKFHGTFSDRNRVDGLTGKQEGRQTDRVAGRHKFIQTERRTDRYDEANCRFSQFREST
jgi:hypothetical protein